MTEWLSVMAIIVALEIIGVQFAFFPHPSLGYDKLLHFLAGIACGIFGVAILDSSLLYDVFGLCDPLSSKEIHARRVLFFATTSALLIGIAWEVAQAHVPLLRDASDYNWWDTVGDVIFDTLGGIVISWKYRR